MGHPVPLKYVDNKPLSNPCLDMNLDSPVARRSAPLEVSHPLEKTGVKPVLRTDVHFCLPSSVNADIRVYSAVPPASMGRKHMCALHLPAMFILNESLLLPFLLTMSSVYASLCLQAGIEKIDMSALSFYPHHILLLVLSTMLVCSHDICWHPAFQKRT